jgi:branched-subunit amino acid transport protein
MSTVVAVLVAGLGSLLLRAVPLVGARHLPARVTAAAGYAGIAVIAGLTIRSVLDHHDDRLAAAPVVAAVAVATGLLAAFRGRSVPVAVAAGLTTYLVLAAILPGPG